ncbi:MAG: EAL domain-containing protein, partial [Pseudomonadota bacterium]
MVHFTFFFPAVFAGALIAWVFLTLRRRAPEVQEDVFRLVAQGASDGLVLMEQDSRIVWANSAYCRIMGYKLKDLVGRYPLEFALPPEDRLSQQEARAFRFDPEEERFGKLTRVRNMRRDGTFFMHEFSHAVIPTKDRNLFLLCSRDVSIAEERENALIAARKSLDQKARTDALTGLANRLEMHRALDELLVLPGCFAVMQLDMNDFKGVNDTFGHNAGDALLCHFAEILTSQTSNDWIKARTGGDEFVILAPDISTLDEALSCAAKILEASKTPMPWKQGKIVARPAVGVAIRSDLNLSDDELLNAADVALYAAKDASGASIAAYDSELHEAYISEQKLQKELSDAFRNGQFDFHFQPIVDLNRHRVAKLEMLARWNHPERGLLTPSHFMPAAKKLGLMVKLDEMVVQSASVALSVLAAAGLCQTGLSINISEKALYSEMPLQLIWRAEAGQLDPARISIEVLETAAISLAEDDTAITTLTALGNAGFSICLDDFGMGYAGLAHLAGLDIDGIKIDRGLISNIDSNQASHCVVTALIRLANELNLEIIAEGIESETQIDMVKSIGPTLFQGYSVAKPMPLTEALSWAKSFEEKIEKR